VAGAVVAVAARAQARDGPPLEVVIAAPTGKAAQRLRESLADTGRQLIALGLLGAPELARLTGQVATLHRLLFDRRVGLADLVVIDEVSMADVATLARVLERIPEQTRVLLLGDPDQLASVAAGRVLGDLAELGVDGTAADVAAAYRASDPEGSAPVVDGPPLALCQVRLRKNWRAADAPSICACARLVQERPEAVAPLLDDPAHAAAAGLRDTRSGAHAVFAERIALPSQPRALHAALWERWGERLQALAEAGEPAAALTQLEGWRLLTALRRGPYGSEEINRRFEERLRPEAALARADGHFHGRPLLVTRNDHDCRLYNGDIGIVWQDAEGLAAYFPRSDGGLRRINLHRLGSATGAYALSTHKSQGSQFDHVELVLCPPPPRGARAEGLLSRELLYTAITRARYSVRIWGASALIATMAARRTQRVSGLARFLERPETP
ncbi:MAG: AAA family ATPase, partial [Planctomycetota bacterium]